MKNEDSRIDSQGMRACSSKNGGMLDKPPRIYWAIALDSLRILPLQNFELLMTVLFIFLLLSTSNLKHFLCNSGAAGSCLFKVCRKTGDKMCGLTGDAFSIGSPPRLCQWVGVSPTGQPKENHPSLTPLFRFPAKMD